MTVTAAFTDEAARALPGPEWLQSRRAAARARFDAAGMPSTDEEVWRYSRVDELDLATYPPALERAAGEVPASVAALLEGVPAAATVVTVDGHLTRLERARGLSDRVVVGTAAELDEAADLLGSVADDGPDVFATLNDAFAPDPVVVRVPGGAVVSEPIVVVHSSSTDGRATFPRLVVDAGPDSDVTVVEVQLSGDGAGLVVPLSEVRVGSSARVSYVTVQQLGLATWQIGSQVSSVDQAATFRSIAAGFGGDYARLRTDCRLVGRGASGELDAVYFGEAAQMLDFRTFQEHIAPDTTSNLLFKGAVGGQSRSVYTGLIRVGKDARGTNAFQTNRNIKLSDNAWAESVPNLVIENNDVRCSHASTVGPVAEEERFYLESRGIPTDVAERLIVTGFFDEVLERIGVHELLPWLRDTIEAKFERREEP